VELLVVLTRAAVTQLAAAAQQLAVAQVALAAVPIIGQQYSKWEKDMLSQLPSSFIYQHLNNYLILSHSPSFVMTGLPILLSPI
jgi:hypothetical protein